MCVLFVLDVVKTTFVLVSARIVTYCQQLKLLSDLREVFCNSSLQNLSSKREFRKNRHSDCHTVLWDVNEFLFLHSIFRPIWMKFGM